MLRLAPVTSAIFFAITCSLLNRVGPPDGRRGVHAKPQTRRIETGMTPAEFFENSVVESTQILGDCSTILLEALM